jgi:hypothetical protein
MLLRMLTPGALMLGLRPPRAVLPRLEKAAIWLALS